MAKHDFSKLANRKAAKEQRSASPSSTPPPAKPPPSRPSTKRRATYNFDASDEVELSRLTKIVIDAGIAPRRIEESKVVRTMLRLAFNDGASKADIKATYEALMATDRRRTR